MVFSSLTFVFAFLPLFFLFYYAAGRFAGIRGKNFVLFVFSIVFYAWGEPVYILLMVYSSVLDFVCGQMIEKYADTDRPKMKKLWLFVSLCGNLLYLLVFKYLGFAVASLGSLTGWALPAVQIALPIGISFYTFQTMSYSIDVYRGEVKAQKDFISFAAYVVMFPQLIAGPVVRYVTINKELTERTETPDDFAAGARRFITGLAKKVLIANTMAVTADSLFASSAPELGALGAWTAVIAYTFQIFFDFSGYSDMAIGMGRMIGFRYLENFNYPYIAASITDFWRRWHISMSTFFRDYVYIPLGGSRVSLLKWVRNIFVVWFLTGLWHGAAWNFVLWGLYFGVLLVLEKFILLKYLEKTKILCHVYSLFFIVYGWVIFTQDSLPEIVGYTKAMFGSYGLTGTGAINAVTLLQRADVNSVFFIVLAAAVLFSTPVARLLKEKASFGAPAGYAYDFGLIALLFLCTVQLALGSYNPFIYFRF